MSAPVAGFMDNCCTCNAPPPEVTSAGVTAKFTWPGFPPFTTQGPAVDTLNVRYLTATVTAASETGEVTKSITSNAFNSLMTDNLTGADAQEAFDAGFTGLGIIGPLWPPDHVTVDTATWDSGHKIVLSNPIDASWCKQRAQALLDSESLAASAYDTETTLSYDPKYPSPPDGTTALYASNTIPGFWPTIAVVAGPETPPGSGNFPPVYAWADVQGSMLTAQPGFPSVLTPFFFQGPSPNRTVGSQITDPAGMSINSYSQENNWTMRKAKSKPKPPAPPFTEPVCCETDYFNYVNVPAPPSSCQAVGLQPSAELFLDPPPLAFEQADNSHLVVQTPWYGLHLPPGGGCPCQ